MDQRSKQSPLEILIESIEQVIGTFEGANLFECVGPNPFNTDPRYRMVIHRMGNGAPGKLTAMISLPRDSRMPQMTSAG